jgi:hypothetical protein
MMLSTKTSEYVKKTVKLSVKFTALGVLLPLPLPLSLPLTKVAPPSTLNDTFTAWGSARTPFPFQLSPNLAKLLSVMY